MRWFPDREAAYGDLREAFVPGGVVLLKASHFSGRFDLAAEYLRGIF